LHLSPREGIWPQNKHPCCFPAREHAHLHNRLNALERAHRNRVLQARRVLAGSLHCLHARKLPQHLPLHAQAAHSIAICTIQPKSTTATRVVVVVMTTA
jgi:hypothetical protein